MQIDLIFFSDCIGIEIPCKIICLNSEIQNRSYPLCTEPWPVCSLNTDMVFFARETKLNSICCLIPQREVGRLFYSLSSPFHKGDELQLSYLPSKSAPLYSFSIKLDRGNKFCYFTFFSLDNKAVPK